MKHVCKHPGKIARAAIAYLRNLGATVAPVHKRKCLSLSWKYCGRQFTTPVTRTTRGSNALETVLKLVRQQLHGAGLPVPSFGVAA